jgi:hypothetical protein
MAQFIRAVVNPEDFRRIMSALGRLETVARREEDRHAMNCANDYKDLAINNLLTQKFSSGYAPYHPRYAEWKTQRMMMGSMFWRLYGDLINNVTVFKSGKGWVGGVPANATDSGGKSWHSSPGRLKGRPKRIAWYGRINELGLGNHPARPVFEPTRLEYAASDRYRQRGQESLHNLRQQWR